MIQAALYIPFRYKWYVYLDYILSTGGAGHVWINQTEDQGRIQNHINYVKYLNLPVFIIKWCEIE